MLTALVETGQSTESNCLYANQIRKTTVRAVVVVSAITGALINVTKDVPGQFSVWFSVQGGAHFPRLVITLKSIGTKDILAEATFIPFSFSPDLSPSPEVNLSEATVDELSEKMFNFSEKIHSLSVYLRPAYEAPDRKEMVVDWRCENVVFYESNKPCTLIERDNVQSFKTAISTPARVRVVMKPVKPMACCHRNTE